MHSANISPQYIIAELLSPSIDHDTTTPYRSNVCQSSSFDVRILTLAFTLNEILLLIKKDT